MGFAAAVANEGSAVDVWAVLVAIGTVIAAVVAFLAASDARRSSNRNMAMEEVRSSAAVKIRFSWMSELHFPDDTKIGETVYPRETSKDIVGLRNDGPAPATSISVAVVGPNGRWARVIPRLGEGEGIDIDPLTPSDNSKKNDSVTVYLEWLDALSTTYREQWEFKRRTHAIQGNLLAGPLEATSWQPAEVSEPVARDVIPLARLDRRHWWQRKAPLNVSIRRPTPPEGFEVPVDDWLEHRQTQRKAQQEKPE